METEIISASDHADALERADNVLARGGLVAFPTETVYGVAARAADAASIQRLREVKGRSERKPFTVHVADANDAVRFAPGLSGMAQRMMRKAWPGPLTLILPVDDPRAAPAMRNLNGSSVAAMYAHSAVGLRCPDDEFARALLRRVDGPIVAASANRSGRPPACTGDDVVRELGGLVDLVVDAGVTRYAKPSTIVRVGESSYEVIREGVFDHRIVDALARFRLLFVCTGNTCRSPMASGLARKMIAERLGCPAGELVDRCIEIASAGTMGGGGGPSAEAVAVMQARGIDISDHVATALTAGLVERADEIFVMTRAHYDYVIKLAPHASSRVRLLVEDHDVDDPFGASREDYERCAQTIEEGLKSRLREIVL